MKNLSGPNECTTPPPPPCIIIQALNQTTAQP